MMEQLQIGEWDKIKLIAEAIIKLIKIMPFIIGGYFIYVQIYKKYK